MYKVTLVCFIIVFALACAQTNMTVGQVAFVVMNNPNKASDNLAVPYPGARYGSCLQVTSNNASLYMFAGHTDGGLSSPYLWSYNIPAASWGTLSPPRSGIYGPSGRGLMSCWADSNNNLIIYGGDNSQNDYQASLYSDQWIYNGSWVQISANAAPGQLAQAATAPFPGYTYIYGGFVGSSGYLLYTNALWLYTESTKSWTNLNANSVVINGNVNYKPANGPLSPGSRGKMAYASDTANGRFWIFGGTGPSTVYGDLWYYTISSGLWTFASGKTSQKNTSIADGMPPCMFEAVMAVTTLGNILLYGGTAPAGKGTIGLTYLWKYSVGTNSWVLFSGSAYNNVPPLSQFVAYTPDLSGGAYLFGGQLNGTATAADALVHLIFNECPTGSYVNASGLCSLCPPGTAQNGSSDVCNKCAAGTSNAVSGFNGTSCTPCPLGSYTTTTGKTSCTPCPSGYTTGKTGSTTCAKPCAAGTFGLDGNCTLCSPGYYSNVQKATSCLACAPGTYQPNYGGTYCFNCLNPGTFSNGAATSCYNCPVGYYYLYNKAKNAYNSPYGCKPCPPGTSTNNTVGASSCINCPAGSFTSAYGSANCTVCPVGTAAPNNGTAVCTACKPGFHAATNGSTSCSTCPINRVAPNYGTQYCSYCPYGSIPARNYTMCAYCPTGYYHNATNRASCPIDPVSGNVTSCCSACPINTYTDIQGSMNCKSCPAGFITTGTGSTYCTQCPMNTHRTFNASSCTACPTGYYTPGGSAYCSTTGYF